MNETDEGYIKFFRKALESQAFQNEGLWKVWCWCLLKATHRERWASMTVGKGSTEVHLKPGQFIFGRKTASKELKMKQSTIRNRMKKLKKMRNLDMQPDSHYTIVTIINWDTYQSEDKKEDSQPDRQRTAIGQPEDTDKNVKNVKKEPKDLNTTVEPETPPTPPKKKKAKAKPNNGDGIPYREIIAHLNEVTGRNYKHTGAKTRQLIIARWNDGFTLEDFKTVIDTKSGKWLRNLKMQDFLRPETLFSNKFEGYLNEAPVHPLKGKISDKTIEFLPRLNDLELD